MYTECMKISSPPLTKSIFHNLSSSASCLRLPSLVAGGREAEGRAAGMPAIDVFSKGATSFLHCLKPQIKFQRFAHRILSQRENKTGPPRRTQPAALPPNPDQHLPVLPPAGDIPRLPTARFGPRDNQDSAPSGAVPTLAGQQRWVKFPLLQPTARRQPAVYFVSER